MTQGRPQAALSVLEDGRTDRLADWRAGRWRTCGRDRSAGRRTAGRSVCRADWLTDWRTTAGRFEEWRVRELASGGPP
eukprot:366294-Chlamydomonas_euryale.AAC.2